jgi:hypothetical protein
MKIKEKLVEVKWLKLHKQVGMPVGGTSMLPEETAQILLKENYIKIMTDDDRNTLRARISLGKKIVRVKWLKPHSRFAYSEGNTCYMIPDDAEMLIEGKYVTEISESYKEPSTEVKKPNESELCKVKLLRPLPGYSYYGYEIAKILKTDLQWALEGEYVVLVPDDYTEPVPEVVKPKELTIDCIFLKAHHEFSYSAGNITKLSEEDAKRLFERKYIDFFSEDLKVRNQIYEKLGFPLEKREQPRKRF